MPAVIAVAVWVVAASYGGTRLVTQLPSRVHAERLAEDVQRNSAWSPIYGFADVCQARIPSSASVLLVDATGPAVAVPASQRTGPAAFGLPADLDWPNQAVFAYVLYPRSVSAVGHVPDDWSAAVGSAAYVAVWQQHAYRSADAQAAGRQAENALSSNRSAEQVCSYVGPDGDRGLVFRVASTTAASPLPTVPAAPFGGRVAAYLMAFVGLGALWVIGFVLLRLLPGREPLGAFAFGASLPVGSLAVTLELIALSVLGIGWSLPVVTAPWIAVAAAAVWRHRATVTGLIQRFTLRRPSASWAGHGGSERIALAGLAAIVLIVVAGAPLGLPWSDGFSLYYFKSRAFFDSGSVVPYYTHAGDMLYSFPAHPPLVSLSVAWLYVFIGQVDEHTTLLLWPAFFVSMLFVLYALIRTRLQRAHALWLVLATALIGYELSTQALVASFADLPLAVFLLIACGSFWLWAGDERRSARLLVLAGLFLGGAALTKEEGLVGAAVILAATPLLLGRTVPMLARSRLIPVAIALPVFAVITAGWWVLRASYHLPEMTVHLGGAVNTTLARLPASVEGLGLRAALPLLPFVALALIALLTRSRADLQSLSGRFWFLLVVIAVELAVDAAAVAAAPVEVHHQLAIAASRLVSQVLPLALLASADVWLLIASPGRLRVPSPGEALPQPAPALAPPL